MKLTNGNTRSIGLGGTLQEWSYVRDLKGWSNIRCTVCGRLNLGECQGHTPEECQASALEHYRLLDEERDAGIHVRTGATDREVSAAMIELYLGRAQ